jgi:hypothetical protein
MSGIAHQMSKVLLLTLYPTSTQRVQGAVRLQRPLDSHLLPYW